MIKINPNIISKSKLSYAGSGEDLREIRLDCSLGTNPYGCPDGVLQALAQTKAEELCEYPHSRHILESIRRYWQRQAELAEDRLWLYAGSIDATYEVISLFLQPGAVLLSVAPQFPEPVVRAGLLGYEHRTWTLCEENNYAFNTEAFLSRLGPDVTLCYINHPNNPTGQAISLEALRQIAGKAAAQGTGVLIDEAYGDFLPREASAICLLDEYDNVIVSKSFSKAWGLAGLRAGYLAASPWMIEQLSKIGEPFAVPELARRLLCEAMAHETHLTNAMESFENGKRALRQTIGHRLHMAETTDSCSICLLYTEDPAENLAETFMEQGIKVVSGTDFEGLGANAIRLRLPVAEDMPLLLDALSRIDKG